MYILCVLYIFIAIDTSEEQPLLADAVFPCINKLFKSITNTNVHYVRCRLHLPRSLECNCVLAHLAPYSIEI